MQTNKYNIAFLILFFAESIYSKTWLDDANSEIIFDINKINANCNELILTDSSFPISYGDIINFLEHNDNSSYCSFEINKLIDKIKELSYINKTSIEFSSKSERNFLQGKYNRFYDSNSIAYTTTKTTDKFDYKIKVTYLPSRTYDDKQFIIDESYLSYKRDNLIISIGSKSRWWSPSDKTSLIYSYSARPTIGIEVRNYNSIVPKYKIFKKFIGKYNYEVFINQLESDRDYSNALLFGNRFSFYPAEELIYHYLELHSSKEEMLI